MTIDHSIEAGKAALGPAYDSTFLPMEAARAAVAQAGSQAQYTAALVHFSQLGRSFRQSEAGRLLASKILTQVQDRMNKTTGEIIDPATPHWNQFLNSLAATS